MNLSKCAKEFDDMKKHNEYGIRKTAEMNNSKIVSGSKYIIIALLLY